MHMHCEGRIVRSVALPLLIKPICNHTEHILCKFSLIVNFKATYVCTYNPVNCLDKKACRMV